jgi:hypothetical protein
MEAPPVRERPGRLDRLERAQDAGGAPAGLPLHLPAQKLAPQVQLRGRRVPFSGIFFPKLAKNSNGGILALSARQILRRELRHGRHVRPVRQEGRRLQDVVHAQVEVRRLGVFPRRLSFKGLAFLFPGAKTTSRISWTTPSIRRCTWRTR